MKNPSEKKSTIQRFFSALNIKTPQQKQDEKLLVAITNLDIKNVVQNIKNVAQAIKDGADIHKKYFDNESSLLQMCVEYHARETYETHEEEDLRAKLYPLFNFLEDLRAKLYPLFNLLAPEKDDVNHVNKKGETALSLAVSAGDKVFTKVLLDAGADINIREKSNASTDIKIIEKTPEERIPGCEKMLSEHRDRENKTKSPIHIAVEANNVSMLRLLLEHQYPSGDKPDLNVKDRLGQTPLHLAADKDNKDIKGNKVIIELLLAHGADPEAKDHSGNMPLHLAQKQGNKAAETLLLKHSSAKSAISDPEVSKLNTKRTI